MEKGKHGQCEARGVNCGAGGASVVQVGDCGMEDRGHDAHQMLQRQMVRFAKSVDVREVTAYSVIYG